MSEFLSAAVLWGPGLAAMLFLTVLSGFFSASETALFYLSHDELRALRVGRPRERLAARLISDPDRLLTGVLFCNLVCNLTYFAISVMVGHRLVRSGQHAAAGVFSLIGFAALLTFGEVVPKSLGVVYRRNLATLVSYPLTFLLRGLDPIMPPLQKLTRVLRRVFWPNLTSEPSLDANDLERAVEVSHQSEEVVRHERQVLHNILDLSEVPVEEIMRPRGTYLALPASIAITALRGTAPPGDVLVVQDESPDDIRAAVLLSDFTHVPEQNLDAAAEEVVHVPWCAKAAFTLQLLRDNYCSVAAVVNEYGETIGVVTYEDLLDTILNADPSRVRRVWRREPVRDLGDGRWEVEGITTLRYLARKLDIDYDPDEDNAVTVAGLLSEELEALPSTGQEIVWQGWRVRVTEVSGRGRFQVVVSREAADE